MSLSAAQANEQRMVISSSLQLHARLKRLRSAAPPNPCRGMKGLQRAHEMLAAQNAVGVLIGSAAQRIHSGWGATRLARLKDIDVAVISPHFQLRELFEGGIDWFLLWDRRLEYRSEGGSRTEVPKFRYWANGNNFPLSWRPIVADGLAPGLWLPPQDFVAGMRMHEVVSIAAHGMTVENGACSRFARSLGLDGYPYRMPFRGKAQSFFAPRIFAQYLSGTGIDERRFHFGATLIGLDTMEREAWLALRNEL